MTVPETAVHKENCPVLREDQVRASWQFAIVQPETETAGVEPAADQHLWLCVSAPNRRHVAAAGRLVVNVSQL
ncbi:MAG: hypothetical protein R6W06_07365 [Prochlorococcaceae cyanobacterium]